MGDKQHLSEAGAVVHSALSLVGAIEGYLFLTMSRGTGLSEDNLENLGSMRKAVKALKAKLKELGRMAV